MTLPWTPRSSFTGPGVHVTDADGNTIARNAVELSISGSGVEVEADGGTVALTISGGGGGSQDLASVLGEGNDAGGAAITGLADPTGAQDAATKTSAGVQAAAAQTAAESFATSAADTAQANAETYADAGDAALSSTVTAALALKAPLASPALTGSPTAPTQTALDNSTKLATTAYTDAAVAAGGGGGGGGVVQTAIAPLVSPTTGVFNLSATGCTGAAGRVIIIRTAYKRNSSGDFFAQFIGTSINNGYAHVWGGGQHYIVKIVAGVQTTISATATADNDTNTHDLEFRLVLNATCQMIAKISADNGAPNTVQISDASLDLSSGALLFGYYVDHAGPDYFGSFFTQVN